MSQMSQAQRAIEKPHCCSRARLQGDKCHAPLHNGVRSNGTLHRDHLWKVALLLFCLNLAGGILWAQPQLYASPNPIIVASGTTLGATTLQVNAPKYAGHTLSLYVNAPPNATTPGELFAQGGSSFTATTGVWVSSGMTFFLWDTTTNTLVDGISVGVTTTPLTGSADGCPWGPFTTCTDAVPATNLSKTWIDEGNGEPGGVMTEWNLVANQGSPGHGGQVTGDVIEYPPGYPTCPTVTWQVSGTYSPSAVTSGASAASTSFTWVASNPSPTAECAGYVPVAQVTYTGTVVNATNDYASGQLVNNEGVHGTFSIFADPVFIPESETVSEPQFGIGQGSTVLSVTESINDMPQDDDNDPKDTQFQGRQVFESLQSGASATDGCWQASGGTAPFGSFTVQGSVWNVGSIALNGTNAYEDGIGWSLLQVLWYRQHLPQGSLPCTARLGQTMNILASDPSNPTGGQVVYYPYATHSISVTISSSTVTVTKDTTTMSTPY